VTDQQHDALRVRQRLTRRQAELISRRQRTQGELGRRNEALVADSSDQALISL